MFSPPGTGDQEITDFLSQKNQALQWIPFFWSHVMKALFFMFLLVLCRRVREAGEVRAQTEARVQVMSLAYSSVYGNKVTKLRQIFWIIFGMILPIFRCESCGRTWPRVISSPLQVMTSKTPTSARSDGFYVCTKGSTVKYFQPKLCTIWWALSSVSILNQISR